MAISQPQATDNLNSPEHDKLHRIIAADTVAAVKSIQVSTTQTIISAPADSTTAIQFNKANQTTNVLNIDTTNGRVGIGLVNPAEKLEIASGSTQITDGYYYGFSNGTKYYSNQIYTAAKDLQFSSYHDSAVYNNVIIKNSGSVGIGTTSPTNLLSLGGNSVRTFWMERHTTANTAGNNLTITAGGATAAATDKNGGMLVITPGISTGTGLSSIRTQRLTRASSTGNSDNAFVDAIIVPSVKVATSESTIDLFEIALPTGTMAGGFIQFTITATDGTELQVHSGHATYATVNKGSVYTSQITDEPVADDANACSSGIITDIWGITSGTNKVTISVAVACSTITANDIRVYYHVHNGSGQVITQL